MSFDELEKALEDIDKYVRYEELINYIVEKRKKDQSYNDLIKTKIIEIVDEYCEGKERKEDLISSKEILESKSEYETVAKLKIFANNDDFMDEVVDLYKSKTSSRRKYVGDLFIKCKDDLEGVSFESEPIIKSFDDKYIGNPDILKRVWKYLNTEVLVDASSTVTMDEIQQLYFICSILHNKINYSDKKFYALGCELLKKFYEEEMNRLSNDSENNKDDIERLRINYECVKKLLSSKGIGDKDASFIFNIIADKLLDSRDIINYLVNGEEYDINHIENSNCLIANIYNIRNIIHSVYNDKTEQMNKLKYNHNEIDKARKLTLVKNFDLFSQSVYVMYILQLIEKKPKIILNFTDNEKLEEYIVDKLVDMNILKDVYNEVLSNYLNKTFDYSSLIQIPDYCFTPTSGKDLLQYLMYIPGNDSINSLTYDDNQKILVDALFKIIYIEMAKKYTEDNIELGRKKYIELFQEKMKKLDVYHNLSGFGDYQYKYYCSKRRKKIEDEIQRIKSKDTSGFINLILGKYICDVYDKNLDVIKELGREINQIKTTFMDLCKEVLSDISFDNDKFIVDKNGVTIYNVAVIKNALDEIVTTGGYGTSLEKIKETVKLQYEINYYNFASETKNIEFYMWNKIIADLSSNLLEKMLNVKNDIINSKLSITGLDYFVNIDDYEKINEMLEEDLKKKKIFASNTKREKERKIQERIQYIIAALKLQKDFMDAFSSEKYDKIVKDKNYSRLSVEIEETLKDDKLDSLIKFIKEHLLIYTDKCEFNIINDIIVFVSREIENKINVLSNKISSSPRKASDIEMDNFKELCDRLGKSIDETIRLLSNENNFVMLLGLVAEYDDTLIEMKKGNREDLVEQVFNINPEVSYNLKNNLLTDVTTLLVEKTEKYLQDTTTSLDTIDNNSLDDDLGPKLCKRLR